MLILRCSRSFNIQRNQFFDTVLTSPHWKSPMDQKKKASSEFFHQQNTTRGTNRSRGGKVGNNVRRVTNAQSKINCKGWPSKEHRCILVYHIESMSLNDITDIIKPQGRVLKSRHVYLANNAMSTLEFSTATEAEKAWRVLSKSTPKGVIKITPDSMYKRIETFAPYWDQQAIEKGLDEGSLLTGSLRINPKMFQHAFISDGKNPDVLIDSVVARNRALSGDIVAVKLRPPVDVAEKSFQETANGTSQLVFPNAPDMLHDANFSVNCNGENKIKTGDVVGILEKRHNRLCIGNLGDKRKDKVLFRPIDHSVPRLLVPASQCPKEIFQRPQDFIQKMFVASIQTWHENSMFPEGVLQKFIGDRGEINAETTRILLEHGVDHEEFPPSISSSLPVGQWEVPEKEFTTRRDLRSECVFTIDPSTARDLDDALHCRKVSENLYEVGVHIADVSYFVKPDTPVDKIAAKRCTSVYLVQKVIPMLPPLLCEQLCSLNPGRDKLTFSVIWRMTEKGEVVDAWFGRTIIRSCAKLSYDHAQSFIEEPYRTNFDKNAFPDITDGHCLDTLRSKVLHLHKIAQSLRKHRFESGALRLDQVKLAYTLDGESGMPNSCYTYDYKESNALVEEFMLLANITVAHKLNTSLPEHAFLRCHPKPKEDMLNNIAAYCESNGLKLDVSSSKGLAASLLEATTGNDAPRHSFEGLQMLVIKPQELALYFCAGCVDDEELYRHYALNIPLYTHFTSPIRRYADIMVHRQLSVALGDIEDSSLNSWSLQELQRQAQECNNRKSEAKKVQDLSVQLFFYAFVKAVGSVEGEAVVIHVHDHSFDILPVKYGQVYRVYLDNLPIVGSKQTDDGRNLELLWPCDGSDQYKLSPKDMQKGNVTSLPYSKTVVQTISAFSTVNAVFEACEKDYKIKAYIKRQ